MDNSQGQPGKQARSVPQTRVTLPDVAKHAGVSIATVSRVVTRPESVAQATRERVTNSIRLLGYHPNAIARSLRSNRTRTIGLIIRHAGNANFAAVASGAQDAAYLRQYNLIIASSAGNPDRERDIINLLTQYQVDGLVIYVADERQNNLAFPLQAGTPVVLVESELEGTMLDQVYCDNAAGARAAVEYLIDLGHRRIAVLLGTHYNKPARDRLRGYAEAHAARGLPVDYSLIVDTEATDASGMQKTLNLMARSDAPTAIFASTGTLTTGALRALRNQSLIVPDYVSVVGFDDGEAAQFSEPPVTVVSRDLTALGRTAVDVLLSRIQDQSAPACDPKEPSSVMLPTELILRRSCARPRSHA